MECKIYKYTTIFHFSMTIIIRPKLGTKRDDWNITFKGHLLSLNSGNRVREILGFTVKAPYFGNGLNFGRGFQLTFVAKF